MIVCSMTITHRFVVSRVDDKSVFVQIVSDENGLDVQRGSLTMPDEEWELFQKSIYSGQHYYQDCEYKTEFVVGHIAHAFLQGAEA